MWQSAARGGTWSNVLQFLLCCPSATRDSTDVDTKPPDTDLGQDEYGDCMSKSSLHPQDVECGDSEDDVLNSFEYLQQRKNESLRKEQNGEVTVVPITQDVRGVALFKPNAVAILYGIIHYDSQTSELTLVIDRVEMSDSFKSTLNASQQGDEMTTYQLSAMLSPTHKPLLRTKEKALHDLTYKEEYHISLESGELENSHICMQLFQVNFTPGKQAILCESYVSLSDPKLSHATAQTFQFLPAKRSEAPDSLSTPALSAATSELSIDPFQEDNPLKESAQLQVGLKYDIGIGRLMVQVLQGSNFQISRSQSKKPLDTFVKVVILNSAGKELNQSKTGLRKADNNPAFNETFVFQVAQFQLPLVTLHFSVYQRKALNRKDMLGWFTVGNNASGATEEEHWNALKNCPSELVTKWHSLLQKR